MPQYSEKHDIARKRLPEDLRLEFDKLVEHYSYAAVKHHGRPWVSYDVLAELIRLGWRDTEPQRTD